MHQLDLDRRRRDIVMGNLAEQNVDGETAPRKRGRMHGLVLERATHLAGAASKLAFCCYIESVGTDLHHFYDKITGERGL